MPPIISFIGWHNSGKTTLSCQIVSILIERGYKVGVVKSSKETGLLPDQPGTDTYSYKQVGADPVALVCPDKMVFTIRTSIHSLSAIADEFYREVDIVIGEGFKWEKDIPKIEVSRGESELLRNKTDNVIAIATDRNISGNNIFRLDQIIELSDFIEQHLIKREF
jgi:molybdopterin-guanine dinucleotide biosynthesis protein B